MDPIAPSRSRNERFWDRVFGRSVGVALLMGYLGLLSGCATTQPTETSEAVARLPASEVQKAPPKRASRKGTSRSRSPKSYVVFGKRYYIKASAKGHVERGLASWYGPRFHGRKTSNGERYNMYALTAAHKTLPLPCYVEVTNLKNGRKVIVRVNDRGPFHRNRIIDLSYAAARKLGILERGTAPVEIRTVEPRRRTSKRVAQVKRSKASKGTKKGNAAKSKPTPPARTQEAAQKKRAAEPRVAERKGGKAHPPARNALYVQVGAFGNPENAERLRERLVSQLGETVRVCRPENPADPPLYRVHVGPLPSPSKAKQLSARLAALGVVDHPLLVTRSEP